ncbi:MAG: lysylphosphatidylglycerol synthase domain-containing protein [Candidatus Saccharimonadales bacterium]
MRSTIWRTIGAALVLTLTICVFVYYFIHDPNIRNQLSHTSIGTIVILLLLYFGTIGALMMVTSATLRLCGISLNKQNNLLLNAYTTVINFFGPLQSGPAFRAVYLKKRYHLSLKKYAAATLFYYFFFALISAVFLFSGILKWWLLPIVLVIAVLLFAFHKNAYVQKRIEGLNIQYWYFLAFATLVQLSIVATIYFIELHTLSHGTVSVSQAIIYTGAANFALFVSITPGAIGFREAFLAFSRNLHHIGGGLIISANILDRAIYLLLLLFLALFIFVSHAKQHLNGKDTD